MTEGRVRVGLLGAGAVAQVAHLPAYSRLRNAELFAICDSETGKLRALRERTGVSHAVPRLDDLLAIDELDAVDVCLPSHLHRDAVIRCLEAGKHVLCEKPLGLSGDEVSEILAARERSGKQLLVGMNNRYRDDSIELRRFVQDGSLGDVFYAHAGWLKRRESAQGGAWHYERSKAGGGVVMDLGIQLLDLVLWLCRYPRPVRVSASFYYHMPGIDVEDSAVVVVECESGLTITLEASWHFLREKDLHFLNLYGTEGSGLLSPLRVLQRARGKVVDLAPGAQRRMRNIYMESYERELAFFAEVVAGRRSAPPLSEQLELTRVVDAARRSAAEGREVRLDETPAAGGA